MNAGKTAAAAVAAPTQLRFRKRFIAAESYESAAAWDIDGDGVVDILSGAYWYQGPDFSRKRFIGELTNHGSYHDDFSSILLDVDGDGRLDVISGAWVAGELYWRQCPADPTRSWPRHVIAETGNIETTRAWDLDGDGIIEIVPNTPGADLCCYKLVTDARGRGTGRFTRHLVKAGRHGHGLGCGDIDGDGRPELIVHDGWLKPDGDPCAGPWSFHPDFELGCASVPIIVADLTGNGVGDLIVGQAHGYGLHWYEQRLEAGGERRWIKHVIDEQASQYHDLRWVDIDGDGACELITGKRYHAHNGTDPGADDPLGIYCYRWNGTGFDQHVIAHGPLGEGAGCGIHFDVADLTGDGRLDIIAPGKDGLHIFLNEGGAQ